MPLRKYNLVFGAVTLAIVIGVTLVGLFYTPFDPIGIDLAHRLAPPSSEHWFGTDQFGRDIFSRVMAAGQVSASVSLLSVAIAVGCGAVIGLLAGFFGGWLDRVLMVFLDALLAIPGILLALAIMVALGPSLASLVIALGIAYTPSVARVMRGAVFSIRQQDYVEASRSMGDGSLYTIARHVAPNCITPLSVIASSLFSAALLTESALSFLGLGVPPPNPTWGGMLADGKQYFASAIWLSVFPGIVISITLLAINLLGDAMRDRFDPRMNET